MKILLCMPFADGETGVFIKRALLQLGVDILCLDARICPKRLTNKALLYEPDVILYAKTVGISHELDDIARLMKPKPLYICWNFDARSTITEFHRETLNLFGKSDILYTVASGNIREYQEMFPHLIVKHLRQGCDLKTHAPRYISQEDYDKYKCDVMFAGSKSDYHKDRNSLITSLVEDKGFTTKIYGLGWGNGITPVTRHELTKAHQCSKIVIGSSGWPDVECAISVRDYKAMASGAFLITRYVLGMEHNWESNICKTFKTNKECIDLVKEYVKPQYDDYRKMFGEIASTTMAEKHTYSNRLQEMLSDIEEIL